MITRGSELQLLLMLRGGGKRARVQATADDSEDAVTSKRINPFQGSLEVEPNDPKQIIQAINVKSINIRLWLETLDVQDLAAVDAFVDKHSRSLGTDQSIRCFVSYIREFKALEDMYSQYF